MRTAAVVYLLVCWWGGLILASNINTETSPATIRLAAHRSTNQPLQLQVDAFNKRHHLTLNPAPSPFAPNFRLQRTARNDHDTLVLQDIEDAHSVTDLYHDPTTGAIIRVEGSNIEGLITPTVAIKPFDDGTHHALRQYNATPSTDLSDYLELPEHLRNIYNPSITAREVRVTPELYVIVDSILASALGSNEKVKEYLAIFFNAVNQRFATMDDPKVQIMLSGALIVRDSADEAYINDNMLSTQNIIDGSKTLKSLSDWLYQNKDSLPAYDLAYLMTGKDVANVGQGQIQIGLAGIAWRGAACVVAEGNKRSFNTGMGEDMGVYYKGVMTAVHELAHNLGAPHDGADGAEACSWDLGYIMSYVSGNSNKLFFSSCSKKLIKSYISSSEGNCLRTTSVGSTISLSSQLPGQVLSLDEQCQKATGKSVAFASKNVNENSLCVQLECQWKVQEGRYIYTYTLACGYPAAEGSPCRSGGACRNGVCV